jgi:hypothetical protein
VLMYLPMLLNTDFNLLPLKVSVYRHLGMPKSLSRSSEINGSEVQVH